jgi:hypothetical protein
MERAATIDFTKAQAQAKSIAVTINHEGTPHPTFVRASQNMAAAAAPLDTLTAPSTDEVDKVYLQLKDILSVATEQQAESSLQQRAKVSVSSPGRSKASQQRTAMEHPTAGIVSSPVWAPSYLRPGHLSRCPEPPTRHQAHEGHEGARTACTICIAVCTVIKNGVASAPRGQGLLRSGTMCVAHASLSIFGHPTTSSNTTQNQSQRLAGGLQPRVDGMRAEQ